MKVKTDEALERYVGAPAETWFTGARIKSVRDQPLTPGGRTRITLFERAAEQGALGATNQLGIFYLEGEGVPLDERRAIGRGR